MSEESSHLPPTAKRLKVGEPKRTPSPDRQHYGALHQKLRKLKLEQTPLCEYALEVDGHKICTGWATEADHLQYPATRLDHYASACSACHRHVTLQRRKQKG